MSYSVIMSVYNKDRPEWLMRAIESLLRQKLKSDDIIIIVDGPLTPELDEVILQYSKEAAVSIIRLEENKGLGNALNIGIRCAKNELIGRMDSDDIAIENRFALQAAAFKKDSEIDILGGQIAEFVDDTENVTAYRYVPTTHEEICKFARRRSPFNHPTVMYKKSVIQKLGGYDVTAIRIEDYDLWLRAIASGAQCSNLDEVLLHYRATPDAMKRRKTFTSLHNHIKARARFYSRKHISLMDFAYGAVTQTILFVIPASIADKVFKKVVRHEQ